MAFAQTGNLRPQGEELLSIEDGVAKVGIDRAKGAAIAWLSWKSHAANAVNIADPGRLIQQSYYAGLRLDRRAEGQSKAWSPWSWNPIQGGGVGSWARVTEFKRDANGGLYSETIPNLWDMPNEPAAALMHQWTSFEPDMPGVIQVKCELVAQRNVGDRWGPAKPSPQEIPACYFTRNFSTVKSYLGHGEWRTETVKVGPPWNRGRPPLDIMACFNSAGEGIAIFSPTSRHSWNFGLHGDAESDSPTAGPCTHIAPIGTVELGPQSTFRYRYWLVVGSQQSVTEAVDRLLKKYAAEKYELINP